MPRKNSQKTYVKNGFYHVYNRGVDKRKIFMDDQDYSVFLHLLKYYLSPLEPPDTDKAIKITHPLTFLKKSGPIRPRPIANLYKKAELIAYCLMPNHFHLLVKQNQIDGMSKLMLKISTTYSMYFNKRYKRTGHLFESSYKAVLISNDEYLLHLSRYIHLNPTELTGVTPVSYPYSSYKYYLNINKAEWIKPKIILNFFKSQNEAKSPYLKHSTYKDFVENNPDKPDKLIKKLIIE